LASPPDNDPRDAATVRCPTCRADQEWSDTCRRCRCDLRLLREFAASCVESRRHCLAYLRAGRPRLALHAARRYRELSGSDEALRLAAVAALLAGDLAEAATLARFH
jgi:hypothetical protein